LLSYIEDNVVAHTIFALRAKVPQSAPSLCDSCFGFAHLRHECAIAKGAKRSKTALNRLNS
jgi:hypothetical protein